MKQHKLAALQLAALHTAPWVLLICVSMAVVQIGAFVALLHSGVSVVFVDLLQDAWIPFVFRLALGCICVAVLLPCSGKSKCAYLVRRLHVPTRTVGVLYSLNTALCLIIVWSVEVLVVALCHNLFCAHVDPTFWSAQSFFVDCYGNKFLHALLPMSDTVVHVRNVLSIIALSLASGGGFVNVWGGTSPTLGFVITFLFVFLFESAGSTMDYILIVLYVLMVLGAIVKLLEAEDVV